MRRGILRVMIGFFIGAFAGLSLATAIIPMAITNFFDVDSLVILLEVGPFGLPLALLFALTGGLVGWQGGTLFSGAALGICGALAGLVLSIFGLSGDGLALVMVSMLTGLIYGGLGGLIIGKAFSSGNAENET